MQDVCMCMCEHVYVCVLVYVVVCMCVWVYACLCVPLRSDSTQLNVIPPSLILSLNLSRKVPSIFFFSRVLSLPLLMNPITELKKQAPHISTVTTLLH